MCSGIGGGGMLLAMGWWVPSGRWRAEHDGGFPAGTWIMVVAGVNVEFGRWPTYSGGGRDYFQGGGEV